MKEFTDAGDTIFPITRFCFICPFGLDEQDCYDCNSIAEEFLNDNWKQYITPINLIVPY